MVAVQLLEELLARHVVTPHVDGHDGGHQAEHLVGLHLDDVVGRDEDGAAHLVRAADGVARVERALLRRRARFDLLRLDALGRHGLQQAQQEDARLQRGVAEAADLGRRRSARLGRRSIVAHAQVGPRADVLLVHAQLAQEGEHACAHELPDDGQRELGVAVGDVGPVDAHGAQLQLARHLEGVVAVLDALVDGARLAADARPVDDARPQPLLDAQQQDAVAAVLGKPVGGQRPAEAERSDPVAEGKLLTLVGGRAECEVELGQAEVGPGGRQPQPSAHERADEAV